MSEEIEASLYVEDEETEKAAIALLNSGECPQLRAGEKTVQYGLLELDLEVEDSYELESFLVKLSEKHMFRCHSLSDYGYETFYYFDHSGLVKNEIGDETGEITLVQTYLNWHINLPDDIWVGSTPKEVVVNLIEKYGNYDKNGALNRNILTPILTENNANIEYPYASPYWNRYIPYIDSLVSIIVNKTNVPPNDRKYKFERTFILYDYIGYVFSWRHKEYNVYYLYFFIGSLASSSRLVLDREQHTVDMILHKVLNDDHRQEEYYDDGLAGKAYSICIAHDLPGSSPSMVVANSVIDGQLLYVTITLFLRNDGLYLSDLSTIQLSPHESIEVKDNKSFLNKLLNHSTDTKALLSTGRLAGNLLVRMHSNNTVINVENGILFLKEQLSGSETENYEDLLEQRDQSIKPYFLLT